MSEQPPNGAPAPVGMLAVEPIRVLVVDDHAVVREGIRHVLEGEPDFTVVAEVTAALPSPLPDTVSSNGHGPEAAHEAVAVLERPVEQGSPSQDDTDLLVVRDKTHQARPMTTADALHEMELVGHDFFLFLDADSGRPSVVYRRHGYDYGVIRLASE